MDLDGHRVARTDPATGAPSPRGAAGDVHAPAPHRLPPRLDRRADRSRARLRRTRHRRVADEQKGESPWT
ncbi:MAG: hypothetical protein F4X85_00250 [Acidimicrobiaceae bacterium]|nr:hypothetical protein [Acidimicrobiaceae bacterium]